MERLLSGSRGAAGSSLGRGNIWVAVSSRSNSRSKLCGCRCWACCKAGCEGNPQARASSTHAALVAATVAMGEGCPLHQSRLRLPGGSLTSLVH